MYCREVVEVVEKKKKVPRLFGTRSSSRQVHLTFSPSPPSRTRSPFCGPPSPHRRSLPSPLAPTVPTLDPRPPPPEHFFPRHEARRIPLLGKKTPFSRISARRYPRRAARCFSMSPIVLPAPNSQLASSAGKES